MRRAVNILVLAAGQNPSDLRDGDFPLCLTEFDGVPLIEKLARKLVLLEANRHVFVFPEEDVRRFHLDNIATLLLPHAVVLHTKGRTLGAACTALLGIEHIDNDDELLIISANELVDVELSEVLNNFRARNLDAGTITFHSIHPRYSYVRTDEQDLVVEAAQCHPISRRATVGIFWFSRGRDFVASAMEMIKKGAQTNGSYFICPSLNEMVLRQKRIGVQDIEARLYHPLKSERQISRFEHLTEDGTHS